MLLSGPVVLISAVVPLTAALISNRSTSLIHATVWSLVAWAAWLAALIAGTVGCLYLALGLTGCAGVAVLGARRPGATAWNFVVAGLLVVLSLPMAEAVVLGTDLSPGVARTVFLASLLGVTAINYLPTRLGVGALLLAVGGGRGLVEVMGHAPAAGATALFVGLAPWAAWVTLRLVPNRSTDLDRLWRGYRDRFGLVWGQRLREQFNRAAASAGWKTRLDWTGLETESESPSEQAETLIALMKRFGPPYRG